MSDDSLILKKIIAGEPFDQIWRDTNLEPQKKSWEFFTCACQLNRLDLVSFLLDHGFDPNMVVFAPYSVNALHYATMNSKLEIINLLIPTIQDINAKSSGGGGTVLHIACQLGNLHIVNVLIRAHANVNIRNYRDETPLHLACRQGNKEVVEALLIASADPNLQDQKLDTPLHIATEGYFDHIVDLLLKYGANKNVCDRFGMIPQTIAHMYGYEDLSHKLR